MSRKSSSQTTEQFDNRTLAISLIVSRLEANSSVSANTIEHSPQLSSVYNCWHQRQGNVGGHGRGPVPLRAVLEIDMKHLGSIKYGSLIARTAHSIPFSCSVKFGFLIGGTMRSSTDDETPWADRNLVAGLRVNCLTSRLGPRIPKNGRDSLTPLPIKLHAHSYAG
jgi:hypothetical protein